MFCHFSPSVIFVDLFSKQFQVVPIRNKEGVEATEPVGDILLLCLVQMVTFMLELKAVVI
jgi:hypothetical protein